MPAHSAFPKTTALLYRPVRGVLSICCGAVNETVSQRALTHAGVPSDGSMLAWTRCSCSGPNASAATWRTAAPARPPTTRSWDHDSPHHLGGAGRLGAWVRKVPASGKWMPEVGAQCGEPGGSRTASRDRERPQDRQGASVPGVCPGSGRGEPSQARDAACSEQLAEVVAGAEQHPLEMCPVLAAKQQVPGPASCRVFICPKTGSTMAFRRQ